ncbi:dihydrolipoyl dehydrogenase family protein [Desulfovibrio gilichinskyi]|uniref:Glutathione reductase (NADPH) n=1 Tax=Desulfovibrio gilichinskyi TaxID=1519643 RepID=A0A1X7EVQ7_9BACT|nr:NAD(P)/FAD-dependent oxidoreductase [Desulfovibrio gilichinskyi]SMF41184.1 glutathione reductase (NADPH) [Desulfovibrio gilichinskyi]
MTIKRHDVVILGSGPAGGVVAGMCQKAGLDVVVVEEDGWGGVCPLRGCEPKKVLVDATHAVSRIRDMEGHGPVGSVSIDWQNLMQFKRALIDPIPDAVLQSLEKRGIKTVSGHASFVGEGQVEVSGYGILEGKHVVIATGARTRPLNVSGEELLLASRQFLELDTMPKSILFIGGGFISFEFACVAAAAGADVTIVHRSSRVLKGFDHDLSLSLIEGMKELGIKVFIDRPVLGVEKTDSGIVVTSRNDDGEKEYFTAELGVIGVGRIPNVDRLNLDAAGVTVSKRGVVVNDFMQSVSNPRVFAAGDCAEPGTPLTPLAVLQATTVARNIIDELLTKSDLRGAASVVFTHPPLMSVGMLEEEARKQGLDVIIHSGDAAKWSEHKRLGLKHAGYKIIEDRSSGRIVGAHYLGQHAEEVANIFGMAIRHGLTRENLMDHPWAYPSFGYTLRYMFS